MVAVGAVMAGLKGRITARLAALPRGLSLPTIGALKSLLANRGSKPDSSKISGLVAGPEAVERPDGRRRRWLMIGGGVILVGTVLAAGAATLIFSRRKPPPLPPPPVVDQTSIQLRRLQMISEQLNLDARRIGDRIVIYVPDGARAQTALKLSNDAPVARRPVVISLTALADGVRDTLRKNGLELDAKYVGSDGPTIVVSGSVSNVLHPILAQTMTDIRHALRDEPLFAYIHLEETQTETETPAIEATFVGSPTPKVFLADGPHTIGDRVFGDFQINAITAEGIKLVPDSASASPNLGLMIPVHGPSILIKDDKAAHSALTTFQSAILTPVTR